jgi:thiol-disulfide isomerase/thioredoxin
MITIRTSIRLLAVLALGVGVAWCQSLKEIPSYALKRGDTAPPLGFEAVLNGPQPADINWQALRGKVVILDFWGSWCAPCVAGIPHLNDLVSTYRRKPVQFIAVGHENARKVAYFLKKHPIDTWVALDTDVSVFKSYTAFGVPHAVIVDQKGIVAAVLSPGDLTEKVIDDVLAGREPTYPPLPPNAYFNPDTAAEYFVKVGQEEPPAEH